MHRLLIPVFSAVVALAAPPQVPPIRPEILGTLPHGAQRGAQVEITIRGRNLQDASAIRFATPKIDATVLEASSYRIRARFRVAAGAEPGRHDFRIFAPHGSTIGWFDVSTRGETPEKEPNNEAARAQAIAFPLLLNGLVRAGDYDYFRFQASAGETLTFDLLATRNGSPLDGVLSLLDEAGREIAYSDDYYMFKDPHLVHRFEKAGAYFLRVHGTGESGSDNSDYRLIAGAMPHVDFALPAGGRLGSTVEFALRGVNLDAVRGVVLGEGQATGEILSRGFAETRVRMQVPHGIAPGVYRLHVEGATLPVPFVVSTLPEITTLAPASRQRPAAVTLPVVANGVLEAPGAALLRRGAAHFFSFRVDAPETVVLQADSMQLGFLLDPLVALYDASGERLAWQDEPTTNTGKEPSNLDPHLVFRLPRAGAYLAMVRDSQFRGDPNFPYRLTIKRARPDFTLTTIGTDETLFRGRENIVTVRVRRLEGWDAPVEIWAENLPAGASAPKVIAQPHNTSYKGTCGETHFLDGTGIEIPITLASSAPFSVGEIRFRGRGVMNGMTVEHEAGARYWWRTLQKVRGLAATPHLVATLRDAPLIVLNTPERVSVGPQGAGTLTAIVTRLDEARTPLRIEAEPEAAGVSIEPLELAAGATRAELRVRSTSAQPVKLVLKVTAAGHLLGRSHPIVVDRAAKAAAPTESDEN